MVNFFGKFKRRGKKRYQDIDPDLIFLDSKNLPDFDTHQFEGRLEKPISQNSFRFLTFSFGLLALIFVFKFWSLQIVHGAELNERSENNKLKQILIPAPRGIITSRDGVPLGYNQISSEDFFLPLRKYYDHPGFGNLLGFIKYPAKDKSGFYYEEEFLPKDGAELQLNNYLAGKNGLQLIETSVNGDVVSQGVIEPPKAGDNVTLSVDARVQEQFYKSISDLADKVGFEGGAGIIMDVESGEILSMVTYPEYDSQVMTDGSDSEAIKKYFESESNPFLNRMISGLYAPGSIVKPFVAFAALQEKVISPEKTIISTGSISVPNPYFPDKPSVFKDWKAHGAVDMRRAIAVSSDVYFYEIGGGFKDQPGLGIERLKKYLEAFGFSKKTGFNLDKEETGTIPDPDWKARIFNGEIWRLGDTYNTSIGQYGMQITPIQAVRAVSAIANGGTLLTPSLVFTGSSTVSAGTAIEGDPKNFQVVRDGMRASVADGGTAQGLNLSAVHVAGKTGTAEIGARKQLVNSWVIGFFPAEKPKYAFTVVMERGPVTNLIGGTFVMRQLLDWMAINTPEYLKNEDITT